VGITKYAKVCGAGFLIKKELTYLKKALDKPAGHLLLSLAGQRSQEIRGPGNLIEKVDKMIIGGGMAFTFLKALGYEVGQSIVEDDLIGKALQVMETAKSWGSSFICPLTSSLLRKKVQKRRVKSCRCRR